MGEVARAIIAARDKELRKQEPVAWMIECSNAFVGWWNDTTKLDCRYFDADPNKGRRFNTKEEAEELIQSKGNSCMKATGHLWVNEGTLKDGMKLSAAPIPPAGHYKDALIEDLDNRVEPTPSQQEARVFHDKLRGVGRDDENERTLIVYFNEIPSDDDLRKTHDLLRHAPIPPTIPEGWQLVPKVGTQGCMPCSNGDKPPHDAEPVKDDEWVQCYLYTLLDEAKRRGGMFPQTREEQNDDSKAIARVADMVRFYGQQGYPKQNAIAKLQALRERNRK